MTSIMFDIDIFLFSKKSGKILFNFGIETKRVKRNVVRIRSKIHMYIEIGNNIRIVYLTMRSYICYCLYIMLKCNILFLLVTFYSYKIVKAKEFYSQKVMILVRNCKYIKFFIYNVVPGYSSIIFVLFKNFQFLKSMMILHLITTKIVRSLYFHKTNTMESRTNCGFKHVLICHNIMLNITFILYCSMETRENPTLPDTSRHPPNLPPGYDSKLYPKGSDELSERENLADQMTDISVARKWSEVNRLHSKKSANYQELRDKYEGTTRGRYMYCSLCSEVAKPDGYPEPT